MSEALRQCPTCGGEIHSLASRCKHCKAVVAPDAATPPPERAATSAPASPRDQRLARWPLIAAAVAIFAIGVSVGMWIEKTRVSTRDAAAEPRPGSPAAGRSPRPIPDRMPAR